jgi:hypothetical protein
MNDLITTAVIGSSSGTDLYTTRTFVSFRVAFEHHIDEGLPRKPAGIEQQDRIPAAFTASDIGGQVSQAGTVLVGAGLNNVDVLADYAKSALTRQCLEFAALRVDRYIRAILARAQVKSCTIRESR